jgi:steroid 5-alpha reductase family enzyme
MCAAAVMLACWLIYRRTRVAAIVDVGWVVSAAAIASLYAAIGGRDPRQWLLAAMIAVWAGRLAIYLLRDRVVAGREDGRYETLRERWGAAAEAKFFVFFQAQAVAATTLSLPALLVAADPGRPIGAVEIAAVVLWISALVGESVADRQLERFKATPDARGRTCRVGLWRYSRHPNYFFEWLVWAAYALFALRAPWGLSGASAPLIMLYLMLRVTGIPPTEAQALRSRGDDYRDYQRTTSAFFPWFPRPS